MVINSYMQIISENFDITHAETRKTLLAIDEADQNQVLVALAGKLYDNIIDKVDDIDFGSIPSSKGDITQIENYDKLIECIDTMEKILSNYKQSTDPILVIKSAVNNIKTRTPEFEKGYRIKNEMTMLFYCSIVLAVISSTSLLISSCIEFIKNPNNDDFNISLSKVSLNKTKKGLLFNNLKRFNKICENKSLDKSLDYVMKMQSNNFLGSASVGAIVGAVAIGTIILNILPIIRELIFFFFYSRTKMSDYFEVQANLLQMNAYNLQNSNPIMKKGEKSKIVKNQLKISDFFKKLSNKLSIESKKGEVSAKKNIDNDKVKYKISDVVDEMPDSASSLF